MAEDIFASGNAKTRKRFRGWWWKIPLTLLLALIFILVIVYIRLPSIVTSLANKKLPEILGTEASVDRIDVKPAKGLAEIHGLRIGQPEGFGDDTVLELGRILAHIDLGSLGGDDLITIRAVELDGLKAHVVRNADGIFNVARLGPPPSDSRADPKASAASPTEDAAPNEAKDPFPGIRIESVAIQNVSLRFTDESAGDRPVEMTLGDMGIDISNGELRLSEGVSVGMEEGSVTLQDIRVSQPAGFGDDALVHLPRLSVDIGAKPFENNIVRLQRLTLEGLRAHVIRDTNGVLNVARLGGGGEATEASTADDDPVAGEVAVAATAGDEAAPAGSPVGVHLAEIQLRDFAVTYTDGALVDGEQLEFVIQDFELSIRDLMAFLPEPVVASSLVELKASIDQGSHPPALLGAVAALGPVDAGIPDLNAQVVLSGIMLDTLGSLVPAGTRQAVGANGADVHVSIALNAQSIDVEGSTDTDAGHSYPILVNGPLSKPSVGLGPVGMAVAGRLTGGIQNLAAGTTAAAADLVQGASGAATEIGQGAVRVVDKVRGGLFGAATAALSLDVKGMGGELKDAVTDVTAEATETVGGAAGSATDQMKESVDSVTGGKKTAAWLEGIPARHEVGMEASITSLQKMPFPPPAAE